MCACRHCTPNWKIIESTLDTRIITGSQSSDVLANLLAGLFKDWQLKCSRSYVTTDRGTNIVKAVADSKKLQGKWAMGQMLDCC